jgi:hypothetical protein
MAPSMEVATKPSVTTLDISVDDSYRLSKIKDKSMLKRNVGIEQMDQKIILHVIDSLMHDAKAKKTYAMQ